MSIEIIPNGHLTTPEGYLAGAVSAGIKTRADALDLAMLVSDREASVAGVFTQNQVRAAAVILSQGRVSAGSLRGLVVNAGCANAITGEAGLADAEEMTRIAGAKVNLRAADFTVASTGVTGVRLPMANVRAGISAIDLSRHGGPAFARAIMTTDTRPKEIAVRVQDEGGAYVVAGCAKGSGMIHPNMATLLAFLTTDASVGADLLDRTLRQVVDETLNLVSIDGDTSCSDTTILFANGASGRSEIEPETPRASLFAEALRGVCMHLARELARDGEGASRLIEVVVTGAASVEAARSIARTITTSPLVKTAIAGCDPNWGRILVAAGRSGPRFDESMVSLRLQGELLFDRGAVLAFDEAAVSAKLEGEEVRIELDLGLGPASATAWGCDLTADYVRINADYRT